MNNPWTWTDEDEKRLNGIVTWHARHGYSKRDDPWSDMYWLLSKLCDALREIDRHKEKLAQQEQLITYQDSVIDWLENERASALALIPLDVDETIHRTKEAVKEAVVKESGGTIVVAGILKAIDEVEVK